MIRPTEGVERNFFAAVETNRIYEAALKRHFKYIQISSEYLRGFDGGYENQELYWEIEFEQYVADNFDKLVEISKKIDASVRAHWNASLLGLEEKRVYVRDEFIKRFGETLQEKHKKHIFLRYPLPRLKIVKKDIFDTILHIQSYDFVDHRDMRKWEVIARQCIELIGHGVSIIETTHELTLDCDEARAKRRISRNKVFVGLANKAMKLGKLVTTGDPT